MEQGGGLLSGRRNLFSLKLQEEQFLVCFLSLHLTFCGSFFFFLLYLAHQVQICLLPKCAMKKGMHYNVKISLQSKPWTVQSKKNKRSSLRRRWGELLNFVNHLCNGLGPQRVNLGFLEISFSAFTYADCFGEVCFFLVFEMLQKCT